jgi:hypothetical protein
MISPTFVDEFQNADKCFGDDQNQTRMLNYHETFLFFFIENSMKTSQLNKGQSGKAPRIHSISTISIQYKH